MSQMIGLLIGLFIGFWFGAAAMAIVVDGRKK